MGSADSLIIHEDHEESLVAIALPLFIDLILNHSQYKKPYEQEVKEKKKEWIPDYFMQSCAYSIMWEERTEIPITQLAIIIAPQEGNPQVFLEHRDKWAKPLLKQINLYRRKLNEY